MQFCDVLNALKHIIILPFPGEVKTFQDAGTQLAVGRRLLCKLQVPGIGGEYDISRVGQGIVDGFKGRIACISWKSSESAR